MKKFWNGLKPVTRCFLIGAVMCILVAAMYFGVIDKDIAKSIVEVAK